MAHPPGSECQTAGERAPRQRAGRPCVDRSRRRCGSWRRSSRRGGRGPGGGSRARQSEGVVGTPVAPEAAVPVKGPVGVRVS
ncbi:hypothetical protein D4740_02935 [Actinomyces sp. 2119]|nr:hypothetical protein D4740_02935 [Actinomyces sp. 2119]